MAKLFLSYRRDDSIDTTDRIFERLAAKFGAEGVFKDVDSIPFGVDFREHLMQAVSQCDILLAVIGDHWLDISFEQGAAKGKRRLDDPRDFVRIEIESAVRRGIPVIPVLVGRASMPAEEDLPESLKQLAYRNAAEVRSGRDFHNHVDRLIRGIEHVFSLGESAAAQTSSDETTPTGPVASPEPAAPRASTPEQLPQSQWRNSLWTFMVRVPPEAWKPSQAGQNLFVAATCVSNREYQQWVNAGGPPPRDNPKGGRKKQTWTGKEFPPCMASHPVVLVSQADAVGFCAWLTQREQKEATIGPADYYTLPSASQWKALARDLPVPDDVVVDRQWVATLWQPTESVIWGTPSPLGLHCLFGNVFEWCLDADQRSFRRTSKDGQIEKKRTNCALTIGGGWASSKNWLRQEIIKGAMGAIWCPNGWPMQDGGFRLWLVKASQTANAVE